MYNQFRSGIMATDAQIRDLQVRKGLVAGAGKRIFRIGRDRFETQPTGRR